MLSTSECLRTFILHHVGCCVWNVQIRVHLLYLPVISNLSDAITHYYTLLCAILHHYMRTYTTIRIITQLYMQYCIITHVQCNYYIMVHYTTSLHTFKCTFSFKRIGWQIRSWSYMVLYTQVCNNLVLYHSFLMLRCMYCNSIFGYVFYVVCVR